MPKLSFGEAFPSIKAPILPCSLLLAEPSVNEPPWFRVRGSRLRLSKKPTGPQSKRSSGGSSSVPVLF